ncbi:hypothetical protein ABIB34_003430 [Rhodococcus sp. UYP5]
MTIALLILAVLTVIHGAISLGYSPDTHREESQFGDYRF